MRRRNEMSWEWSEKERDDIWGAIDNLNTALGYIRDHIKDDMDKNDLKWLNQCIEDVNELI